MTLDAQPTIVVTLGLGVIEKPFSAEELHATVARALGSRRTQRSPSASATA